MATVQKQGVGIDVSKKELSVCFSELEVGQRVRIVSTKTFANTSAGLTQLDGWIRKHHKATLPLSVLMEATGVYYEEAAYFLHEKGWHLSVLVPNKTKAFAKSLDYKSKTDAIDAKILAQMCLERHLEAWQPLSPNLLTLKRLCRERAALQDARTVALNQLHAKEHARQTGKDSLTRSKKLIQFLEKQIQELEKVIAKSVNQDPALAAKVDKLCSIKGVALITAATVIGETDGFALIKNKAQLVSYAGYDVVENQSGSSLRGKTKISKKGNAHLRRAMWGPAMSAVKYDSPFRDLYLRVCQNSRIKMKGMVAVQRKILVLMYTLYCKDEFFDPHYAASTPALELALA